MKVACDRCEKVVGKNSLENWRRIVVFSCGNICGDAMTGADSRGDYLLCEYCYDKMMDFMHYDMARNDR